MVQKNAPLPKSELKRQIKKFLEDLDRGISIKSFAELCGISAQHLKDVFKYETEPLTENVQIRVNKGYDAWKGRCEGHEEAGQHKVCGLSKRGV